MLACSAGFTSRDDRMKNLIRGVKVFLYISPEFMDFTTDFSEAEKVQVDSLRVLRCCDFADRSL